MSNTAIRNKLYEYIRVADDRKLSAIYNLLENEIEQTNEWWKDKKFTKELDRRYQAMENGSDKGITVKELEQSITQLRLTKYSK